MGHGKEKRNKIRCHTRCILGWKMHQKHSRTTFFGWRVHQMHSRDIVGWKGRSKASTKPTVFLVLGSFPFRKKEKKRDIWWDLFCAKLWKWSKNKCRDPTPVHACLGNFSNLCRCGWFPWFYHNYSGKWTWVIKIYYWPFPTWPVPSCTILYQQDSFCGFCKISLRCLPCRQVLLKAENSLCRFASFLACHGDKSWNSSEFEA